MKKHYQRMSAKIKEIFYPGRTILFWRDHNKKRRRAALLFAAAILCLLVASRIHYRGSGSGGIDYGKARILDLRVCTIGAQQPDCYNDDITGPRLTWSIQCGLPVESVEYTYAIQIDDDPDFTSPEIDTGEITGNLDYYLVNGFDLVAGNRYYWRVRVQNHYDAWSGWAAEEDAFILAPRCGSPAN